MKLRGLSPRYFTARAVVANSTPASTPKSSETSASCVAGVKELPESFVEQASERVAQQALDAAE
ncbi:hypothetical protein BRC79_05825, partial [Halobacteriales archaeon QH_8_67_27]